MTAKDEQIKKLKEKIGEPVIDIDILYEAQKPQLTTGRWGLQRRDLQSASNGSHWGEPQGDGPSARARLRARVERPHRAIHSNAPPN